MSRRDAIGIAYGGFIKGGKEGGKTENLGGYFGFFFFFFFFFLYTYQRIFAWVCGGILLYFTGLILTDGATVT